MQIMNKMQSIKSNRLIYLDMIKILALFMVLYNHRSTYTIAASCVGYGFKPIFIQTLATLCRCGVPLFFMASGALLLGKNETFEYILKHRVVRILTVMVLCTFIKAWGEISFFNFINVFFTKLNWYLYAYLDYLLMLPFLRLIAQNATNEQRKVWIILVMVFYTVSGCLIFANYYTGLVDFAPIYNTQFASLCWSIIFTLTGYFLVGYEEVQSEKRLFLLVVGTIVSVILSVMFVMMDINNSGGANIDQLRLHFVYMPSCLIFCFCKFIYNQTMIFKKKVVEKCIITVAGTVFGIFLIETHTELINYVNWKLSLSPISNHIGEYAKGGVSILVQFIICFTIIFILKQIPFIKKIL